MMKTLALFSQLACHAAFPLALVALSACQASDVFVPLKDLGPAGVLDGSVTYGGSLPCTRGGHVVGAAILLGFDTRLLPPPEGLGVTAGSLAVIPGDELFSGVRDRLTFAPNGALWCPDPAAPPVTVSGSWAMGPLPGATYQVRGFYDLDGNFDPGFKISNLPSRGDIGGGAIENAAAVLTGSAPVYRNVPLGDAQPDGTRTIPEEGARVAGVAVTLGLPLPLERPIFYAKGVLDKHGSNTDPAKVVMASDYQLAVFSTSPSKVAATEESFIRLDLGAGLPDAEVAAASAPPFGLPVTKGTTPCFAGDTNMPPATAPCLVYSRQDANGDGVIDGSDHVPEGPVPALFPLAVFAKLASGSRLVNQSEPTVILQGLTLYKSLAQTAFAPATLKAGTDDVLVALRPAVLCLDAQDASKPGVLLTSRPTDAANNPLISDEEAVKANVSAQFKRPIEIAYGCLPQGQYAMNLIYETGQAWTVPNEAEVCAPLEKPSSDGKVCGKRARLASQGAVLTIGPPNEPAYCVEHPTPAACLGK